MYAKGAAPREIGAVLGRTAGSVSDFVRRQYDPKRHQYLKNYVAPVVNTPVPPQVITERDNRANEYRNITQLLMGDPPPSQSALGRPCE